MDYYIVISLTLLGLLLVWVALRNGWRSMTSGQWPTVEGEIFESSVNLHTRQSGVKTYSPHLRYRYEVRGEVYENWEIKLTPRLLSADRSYVEDYLEKYPLGGRVTVYYDHRSPEKSILEPGGTLLWPLINLGFATVCFAAAAKVASEI